MEYCPDYGNRLLLREIGDPTRLMFGSGWPSTDVDVYLKAFELALPSRTRQAVLHDNAARVYGFRSSAGLR